MNTFNQPEVTSHLQAANLEPAGSANTGWVDDSIKEQNKQISS